MIQSLKNGSENKRIVISTIIAVAIFWAHFPWYSFDSLWYIGFVDFFTGEAPMAEWNAVRGFSYPLLLFLANIIKTGFIGAEIVLSFIYAVYCVYILKLFFLVKSQIKKKVSNIEFLVVSAVMLYSPLIWGYAHLVLTEFVAVTVFVVYLYTSYKYIVTEKKKLIDNTIYIFKSTIVTVFAWFLKQNYAVFTLMLFGITLLILLYKDKKLKRLITCTISLLIVVSCWLGSILLWNNILNRAKTESIHAIEEGNIVEESNTEADDTETSIVSVQGVSTSLLLRYFNKRYEDDTIIGSVIDDEGNIIKTFESQSNNSDIKWALECFINAPGRFIQGIWDSYGLLAAIYIAPKGEDGTPIFQYGPVDRRGVIKVWTGQSNSGAEEHYALIYYNLSYEKNYCEDINLNKELLETIGSSTNKLDKYGYTSKKNIITSILSNKLLWGVNMVVFSIVILLIPIICVLSIAIIKREKIGIMLLLVSIPSFVYLAMHIYIGANIDRYAFPVYVVNKFALLLIMSVLIEKIELRRNEKTNNNTCI